MNSLARVFVYEKSVMLNVLYDTLDAMGLSIERANSDRGTIQVALEEKHMRVAVNPFRLGSSETEIRVFPLEDSEETAALGRALLDEISATIQRGMKRSSPQA